MNRPKPPNRPPLRGGIQAFISNYRHQVFVLFLFFVVVIFNHFDLRSGKGDLPKVGDVSKREIIAEFSFPVFKHPDSLEREREEVLKNVPVLLEYEEGAESRNIAIFDSSYTLAMEIIANRELTTEIKSDSLAMLFRNDIEEADIDFIKGLRKPQELRTAVRNELKELYEQGFYSEDSLEEEFESHYFSIKNGKQETPYTKELVLTKSDAEERFRIDMENRFSTFPEKGDIAIKMGLSFLEPNLSPNWDTTSARRQRQLNTIKEEKDIVVKDERIIGLHEKVTEETLLKLASLQRALDQGQGRKVENIVLEFSGWIIINLIFIVLLALYLIKFHRDIWENIRYFDFFIGIMTLCFVVGYILPIFKLPFLLVPVSFMAVIFALFLPLDITLIGLFFVSGVLSLNFGQDFYSFISILMPGTVIAFTFPDLTHRTQIYKPVVYAITLTALFIFFTDHIQNAFTFQIIGRIGVHSLGILLSSVIAIFVIAPFEYALKTTSHFTLSDFAKTNHQLLKQLSVEGPGTYAHSMNIANLAENAAASIDADQILARAGGYFHDIGKLTRPEYFNENDPPESMHLHLSPMESASILVSHVREGVDLARINHLPEPIIDMIKQHHGTTVMRYFYDKAREIDPTFTEENFRYPGPKPQSREAAIIMMCDITEAGVRALDEINHESINRRVNEFINERLLDGQFDEADITIEEITKIKETLVKGLMGIHHKRRLETPLEDQPGGK